MFTHRDAHARTPPASSLQAAGRPAGARRWLTALLLAVAVVPVTRAADLLVFAAASLSGPLDAVATRFEQATGSTVRLSYASSSTLARQVVAGAPAAVFIAASVEWMDEVDRAGLLAPGTRFDWLGNALVVVTPAADGGDGATDLATLLGRGRIALGDPAHVPAGIYARESLQRLGLWDAVASRAVLADNVRAALALVARGEAPLGIVYATDAALEPAVRVRGTLPQDSHAVIRYPVAALVPAGDTARGFLAFLRSVDAARVMRDAGFTVLDD